MCVFIFFLLTNVKKLQHFFFYCQLFYMSHVNFDPKLPLNLTIAIETITLFLHTFKTNVEATQC